MTTNARTSPGFLTENDLPSLISVDEIQWNFAPSGLAIAASASYPLGIAKYPLKVVAASVANWNGDITANDSNFWDVIIRRVRANVTGVVATIRTCATAGVAGAGVPYGTVSNRTDKPFDGATFDPTISYFNVGDILAVAFNLSGSATGISWSSPSVSVRVVPQ